MILNSFIMYKGYMFTSKGLLFLLNSFVFTFAALNISYLIANLVNFNMESLKPIFWNIAILIGFAVAILSITIVVIKQKRMSN